jgi:hypothetical protein
MRTRRYLAPLTFIISARRPPGWVRWHHLVAVVLPLAASGCGTQDLASELDRVRSWSSTTALAADRRAAGAINKAVALQLVARAAEARTASTRSLGELATSDSERAAASALLDSLRDGINRLRQTAR